MLSAIAGKTVFIRIYEKNTEFSTVSHFPHSSEIMLQNDTPIFLSQSREKQQQGLLTTYGKAADFGMLKSAANRLGFDRMAIFAGGWDNMHGKLHGLPKKVLYNSVIITYCETLPGGKVGDSRLKNSSAAM